MTTVEFLINQIIETREFTKRLIFDFPDDLWFEIPKFTDSNFAWQIGHLTIAQNFHICSCTLGRNKQILEKMPIQDYLTHFKGLGDLHRSVNKSVISVNDLKDNFDFVQEKCIIELRNCSDDFLTQKLEPIPFKHPIADNKYQAISWSFKHEMWHCAEIEHIKILLNQQFKWLK